MMLCKQQREGVVWRAGSVVINAAGGAPGLERRC